MKLFASGVASGDVSTDSVVLWTRLHLEQGAGDVEVDWTIDADGATVRSGTTNATPHDDHTVHVDVDGLDPGTRYGYSFDALGATVSGRTRTLPATAERFRCVVLCCTRWGFPGFELFDEITAAEPDLLLHLGDSIYEIGEIPPAGGSTDPPWACHTLNDYRRRYRQYRSDDRFQRLLASAPMLAVWDDHEVADNSPERGSAARRRAGQRAWAEWMPNRRVERAEPLDRFRSIGGLLDLALVDSRFAGRTPNQVDGPGDEDAAPGSMLGYDQWRRLDEFRTAAAAPWFVFANQVQVGPMTLVARPALAWPPWRRIVNPDQWDGYVDDRERLVRMLSDVRGRPVVLSGDLHSAWSRTLELSDGRTAAEFTSPSISGQTYAEAVRERLPIPTPLLQRWLTTINSGIDHLDLDTHGFLICDVTPERWTTTFVMADGRRHTVALDHSR